MFSNIFSEYCIYQPPCSLLIFIEHWKTHIGQPLMQITLNRSQHISLYSDCEIGESSHSCCLTCLTWYARIFSYPKDKWKCMSLIMRVDLLIDQYSRYNESEHLTVSIRLWELKLASRLWSLAQFESVCLCFAAARSPANISDALMWRFNALFIYWNFFRERESEELANFPRAWLAFHFKLSLEFAVVSGTNTRTRRERCVLVGHVYWCFHLDHFSTTFTAIWLCGWSFATTPIQFLFFDVLLCLSCSLSRKPRKGKGQKRKRKKNREKKRDLYVTSAFASSHLHLSLALLVVKLIWEEILCLL